jgi:aldehyde dehydrogenase (NAD+)
LITKVSEATEEDVDIAVEAAQKAFDTTWGLKAPGSVRADLLWKLAQLMERDSLELAALEALDNGKPPLSAKVHIFIKPMFRQNIQLGA